MRNRLLGLSNAGHHLTAESRWRKTFGGLSESSVAGQVHGRVSSQSMNFSK